MADYLCPNIQLSVEDQVQIFQIRSQINPLPANKGQSVPCVTGCGEIMNNYHIFQCVVLNPEEQTHIKKLINWNIYEMKNTEEEQFCLFIYVVPFLTSSPYNFWYK